MSWRLFAFGASWLVIGAAPATACTLALGEYRTTGDYKSAKLQDSEQVIGVFRAESVTRANERATDAGLRIVGPETRGVVTDRRGQAFPVRFTAGGLTDDTECGVYHMPTDRAQGLFWLKRRSDGRYQVLNWQSKTGD